MKKLLFITHWSDRSGAPMLLLNLLRLLNESGRYEIEVLVKHEGELRPEFEAVAKTVVLQTKGITLLNRLAAGWKKIRLRQNLHRYDLVFSNTILNGDLQTWIGRHPHIVTYVHELEGVTKKSTCASDIANVKKHTELFLAPSNAVKNFLVHGLGVPANRIASLPYFVPDLFPQKLPLRSAFRSHQRLAEETFVVCGLGAASERKGVDLFLLVAMQTVARDKQIKFVWCGGHPSSLEWVQAQTFIQKHKLEQQVLLLPQTARPEGVMAGSDLLFLSSREDPYPLVMLEAAMMEVPMIYFRQTGGAEEFADATGARAAAPFEIEEVTDHIQWFFENSAARKLAGRKAREKYLLNHSAVPVLQGFEAVIQLLLQKDR